MKESVFFVPTRETRQKQAVEGTTRAKEQKEREAPAKPLFRRREYNYISLQNYISSFIQHTTVLLRDINKHARTHHILISLSNARDADERVSAKGAALERIHTHHSLNHRSKKILQFLTKKHERVTNGRKPPKKNKKNTKLNDGSPLAGTPPRARNTKTTTLARRRMVLPRRILQPYGFRRHAHVRRRVYVTVERGNRAVVEHVLEPMDVFWRRKFWTKSSTKRVDVFYGVRLV